MTKYLLTDVDGVLLNWLDPFLKYMNTKKVRKTGVVHLEFHKIQNLYYDTTAEDINKAIEEFNTSPYFSSLFPIKKASDYLPLIKGRYDFKIVAITSSNTDAMSTQYRKVNLHRYYKGLLDEVIFVERLQSKKEILATFPSSYWIEDFVPNALEGFQVGHTPIVLKHHYNLRDRGHKDLIFKEDWKDISRHLEIKEQLNATHSKD